MVALPERAKRKVRAPKSSVTVNGRPSKDEDIEPQRRVEFYEVKFAQNGRRIGAYFELSFMKFG